MIGLRKYWMSDGWGRMYSAILFLQIAFSMALALRPFGCFAIALLVTQFAVAARWRGLFNGGSDRMVFLLTLALACGRGDRSREILLVYVAVQATLSYLGPGIKKLFSKEWRSGLALNAFFCSNLYEVPALYSQSSMEFKRAISWSVILFECLSPLSWYSPFTCSGYLVMGCLFHLANFRVLGLNRFFFAWIATYPALYFCSGRVFNVA